MTLSNWRDYHQILLPAGDVDPRVALLPVQIAGHEFTIFVTEHCPRDTFYLMKIPNLRDTQVVSVAKTDSDPS